ncbi:MAG: GGDEF domain-containing phosphodiesterase [Burkholderiaceae bacterium]
MHPPERDSPRLQPAELLQRLGERMARADGTRTALLAIELSPSDRRLAIGHGRAERAALAEVGRRVEAVLRAADRYAFASREELWVLLADLPSESLAELAGRTLLERLRRPIRAPGSQDPHASIRLQPAVGIAWIAAKGEIDALSVLAVATEAAAARRGAGGHGIQLRRVRATRDNVPMQRQVEHDLTRALEDNELEVHFQPQIDLRGGQCRSAEALIRWRHPDGRTVNPEAIVAICEKRDLILQLTRFTLNTTLRQASGWDTLGLRVSVAVNLSAATLSDPSLPLMVSQALDTWDLPADRLTLELTESALIRNQQVARETMRQLKRLGCRLSIDDFGTGYSPYTYLRQFSFDELKIDQSFVRRVNSEAADLRIVQSLVDLAHAFGMHAVAEGVEDEQSERALRALGCDLAQGWFVSAALPADDFAAWCLARGARDAARHRETVGS